MNSELLTSVAIILIGVGTSFHYYSSGKKLEKLETQMSYVMTQIPVECNK